MSKLAELGLPMSMRLTQRVKIKIVDEILRKKFGKKEEKLYARAVEVYVCLYELIHPAEQRRALIEAEKAMAQTTALKGRKETTSTLQSIIHVEVPRAGAEEGTTLKYGSGSDFFKKHFRKAGRYSQFNIDLRFWTHLWDGYRPTVDFDQLPNALQKTMKKLDMDRIKYEAEVNDARRRVENFTQPLSSIIKLLELRPELLPLIKKISEKPVKVSRCSDLPNADAAQNICDLI